MTGRSCGLCSRVDDVEYRLNPPVSNEDLNALLADVRTGYSRDMDFGPVHDRSLGYVCAHRQSELVGYVNVAWDGGVHAFLLDPTVRAECQRQSIGRELVRRAAQLAREGGAEWLHVDFVPELQKFYIGCGFRESRAGLIDLRHRKG